MEKSENLEKTLAYAVVNPDFCKNKIFAMLYIIKQDGMNLKVRPVWNMNAPDTFDVSWDIKVDDIWSFVTSLSEKQKDAFKKMRLDYRLYHDTQSLERFASKLDMDKTFIGYEGEPEDGTWFTCCRIDLAAIGILPENLYIYSLRASEVDDAQPASIEERVIVNHYGDILTDKPLPVPMELEVEPVEYDEEDLY